MSHLTGAQRRALLSAAGQESTAEERNAITQWGEEIAENWFLLNSVLDGSLSVRAHGGDDGYVEIEVFHKGSLS